MKAIVVAAAALAALTGTAVAADLPVKARPMMAPIPYSWTGCYLAAGGGYGLWDQKHRTQTDTGGAPAELTADVDSGGRGWFGTVQGGCDYQVNQSWVIGVFADYDFANISGRFQPTYTPSVGAYVGNEKLSWQWAVGGRVGYLVLPNLLAYVSGGFTQAHFNRVNDFVTTSLPSTPAGFYLASKTYDGFFLGSGYEYGLNWLSPSLFWKTEYRFASFDSENPRYLGIITNDSVGYREHSWKYVQTIRSELVWRFNWR